MYKVLTRLSRTIKAVFRWVRSENRVLLPPSSLAYSLLGNPAHGIPLIDFEFIAVWSPINALVARRGWAYNGLDFHSPLETLLEIRFSVYSEPRAELRLQNCGGVGSAHYSKMVQQIRHRRRFPVPRLPQIENMLGRTGLGREVIDVPVTRTKTPAAWLPRKVVQADILPAK